MINGKSLDITQDNLIKLKQLFPNLVKEGKVDLNQLKATFGEEAAILEEHYGLNWVGKYEAFKQSQTQTTHTLHPDRPNSIEFDDTQNIFIEGENLEVLKILQKSYYGKIKMIYIDPPYNTGNDHFIYPDKYNESKSNYLHRTKTTDEQGYLNRAELFHKNSRENGHFHSVWLSMMYPRLYLARNLLREDGVIFISIDDNEQHNLRLLCNDVFGEENFIGIFLVNVAPNARDYGHIAKMHEYVLFYAKNHLETETYLLTDKSKSFKYKDPIGPFNIHPLYNSNVAFTNQNRPNLYYPFYLHLDKPIKNLGANFFEISLTKTNNSIEIYPPKSVKDNVQFVWRWGKNKAQQNINQEIVGYKLNKDEYRIVQKMRSNQKLIRSIITGKEYTSRRGTAEIESLFNQKIFTFPKPVELIKLFLKVATKDDDIILDFFAGSSTTAQATLELNQADSGNRKFILIQIPERTDPQSQTHKAGYKSIADVGRARIKKVIEHINKERATRLALEPRPTLGFRAFTLAPSNFKIWQSNLQDEQAITKQLEFHQDVVNGDDKEAMLWELLLKTGYPLATPIENKEIAGTTIHFINNGALIIALQAINLSIVNAIRQAKPALFICLDKLFNNDDQLKMNVSFQFEDEGILFKSI